MAYKTCDNCGTKLGAYGCPNCDEMEYISMQDGYMPPPMPQSREEKGVNVYYKERIYKDVPNHFHLEVNHLAEGLTSYPVHGSHSFKDGQQVVEGRDYEKQHQVLILLNKGTEWANAEKNVYNNYPAASRRIVAIPITPPPSQQGEADDPRENDIQKVCSHILNTGVESTGDYGSGGQCPFCLKYCDWNAEDLSKIDHKPDCIYLIAKDLSTNKSAP